MPLSGVTVTNTPVMFLPSLTPMFQQTRMGLPKRANESVDLFCGRLYTSTIAGHRDPVCRALGSWGRA